MRVRLGLTQREIAKALNVSSTTISEIERDKRKLSIELLGKFSIIFGLRPESLMFPNGIKKMQGYKKLKTFSDKLISLSSI